MHKQQKKQMQFSTAYLLIALLVTWLFQSLIFQPLATRRSEVSYSEFVEALDTGKIGTVQLTADRILYELKPEEDSSKAYNVVRVDDQDLINRLVASGVEFSGEAPSNSLLPALLGWIIPMLPLLAIWYFSMRRMGQAGSSVMSIGKSKAKEIQGEITGVKFVDVGGVEEAAFELKEIIEFLRNPEKFTRLGAKLPKGVLLVGPPGTGKTLLARATAGEANVPFFSISGSDFVEMFVGVGASRVRDLFEQAKTRAPCIIFIDEIDALGQSRATVGSLGSNDEREQTLNQLLSEMDGFEANQGVVIMAATNRPEVLDKALLRPGRFDRQVQVGLPTAAGRREILNIHTRDVKLDQDIDLDRIAQITAGFTGADLANIVNEAALLAVRNDHETVAMDDFDLAIERVVAGLQRKMQLKPEVRRRVAYHEGGHALVAFLQPDTDPVHKVSIVPTTKGALGYTLQMPDEDTYLLSKHQLEERLAVMLGGRAAELIVFNDTSTGAANDLERATDIARRMVTEFGMTDALGPVRYANSAGYSYLGQVGGLRHDISPETAQLIDQQTRRIMESAEECAVKLLQSSIEALKEVVQVLLEDEVITGDRIAEIAGPQPTKS
ncbi:MAG: ATP-dependent zinc metalloprotease FtsH [Anaerolineae bacterium]|nr:ATP-dependent zinc metalloprotease FtsH [Anaerolineae bacterium]